MLEVKITRYTGTGTITVVHLDGEREGSTEPRAGQERPTLRLVRDVDPD